jgi:hypothetical protein
MVPLQADRPAREAGATRAMERNTTAQPVVLFEIAKGWLTGEMPDVGEMHHIEK